MTVENDVQDIGWAVDLMRMGHSVRRTGWNGKGMFLNITMPTPTSDVTLPYVYIHTVQHDTVPWLCSQTDLLATDWELVE